MSAVWGPLFRPQVPGIVPGELASRTGDRMTNLRITGDIKKISLSASHYFRFTP